MDLAKKEMDPNKELKELRILYN